PVDSLPTPGGGRRRRLPTGCPAPAVGRLLPRGRPVTAAESAAAPEPATADGTDGPPHGVLVGVDIAGIQRFIYEGRRLLDAIGRATLVADLTDTGGPHVAPLLEHVPERHRAVLRDAGGALYVAFTHPSRAADHAREFTGRYTRRL